WGAAAEGFRSIVGDILIVDEFAGLSWRLRWNGGALPEKYPLFQHVSQWEHITFAPVGIGDVPPVPTLNLNGILHPGTPCPITVSWRLVSGPSSGFVTFSDPNALQTTASFSQPGTYVLRVTTPGCCGPTSDAVRIMVHELPQ